MAWPGIVCLLGRGHLRNHSRHHRVSTALTLHCTALTVLGSAWQNWWNSAGHDAFTSIHLDKWARQTRALCSQSKHWEALGQMGGANQSTTYTFKGCLPWIALGHIGGAILPQYSFEQMGRANQSTVSASQGDDCLTALGSTWPNGRGNTSSIHLGRRGKPGHHAHFQRVTTA